MFDIDSNSTTCDLNDLFPLQVLVLDICVTQRQKVSVLDATLCFDSIYNIYLFLIGIWVWGNPVEMEIDGSRTSVFYLDTEGFESIGKSNVYDDR